LAALVLLAAAGFLWWRASDVFAVKRVYATPTVHVTTEQIELAVAEAMGKNLLVLSTAGIAKRLLEFPYVRSVEVHRRFPDGLQVEIGEYEPVARVRVGEDIWLAAEDGRVLEKAAAARWASLPLVVSELSTAVQEGAKLPETTTRALMVAKLVAEDKALAGVAKLNYVFVSTGGAVVLRLADGPEIRLGEPDNLDQKLKVASKIIKDYLTEGKQLHYVDVSVPGRAAVSAVKAD